MKKLKKQLMAGASAIAIATSGFASDLPNQIGTQSGSVLFDTRKPNSLLIEQSTDKAIVLFDSFNIGEGKTVDWQMPNSNSSALARVQSDAGTEINGSLESNGNLFVVNPNGVLITDSGTINTNGFVASTLDIANDDFLAGNYQFTKQTNAVNELVYNRGAIRTQDYAVLLGGSVENNGTVYAKVGKIGFGAGERITLSFAPDNDFLTVEIPTSDVSKVIDSNGRIRANIVEIKTATAYNSLRSVIHLGGEIIAKSVDNSKGKITIGGASETYLMPTQSEEIQADTTFNAKERFKSDGDITIVSHNKLRADNKLVAQDTINLTVSEGNKLLAVKDVKAGYLNLNNYGDDFVYLNGLIKLTGIGKSMTINSNKLYVNSSLKNPIRFDNDDSYYHFYLGSEVGTITSYDSITGWGADKLKDAIRIYDGITIEANSIYYGDLKPTTKEIADPIGDGVPDSYFTEYDWVVIDWINRNRQDLIKYRTPQEIKNMLLTGTVDPNYNSYSPYNGDLVRIHRVMQRAGYPLGTKIDAGGLIAPTMQGDQPSAGSEQSETGEAPTVSVITLEAHEKSHGGAGEIVSLDGTVESYADAGYEPKQSIDPKVAKNPEVETLVGVETPEQRFVRIYRETLDGKPYKSDADEDFIFDNFNQYQHLIRNLDAGSEQPETGVNTKTVSPQAIVSTAVSDELFIQASELLDSNDDGITDIYSLMAENNIPSNDVSVLFNELVITFDAEAYEAILNQ